MQQLFLLLCIIGIHKLWIHFQQKLFWRNAIYLQDKWDLKPSTIQSEDIAMLFECQLAFCLISLFHVVLQSVTPNINNKRQNEQQFTPLALIPL